MSFFGSKLFGLGGGTSTGPGGGSDSNTSSGSSSISAAETIDRLCDRVQSSLLIEDRHESLRTIKTLSKKYKLDVGTHAMPVLIEVLKQNKSDAELCCLVVDTLFNIMNPNIDESEKHHLPADISNQFTEIFIKDQSNLILLFDLLNEFEFQTRWATVKLLGQIVSNQLQQVQQSVLEIPSGVPRLMDLLSDSREVIRNDALLLLYNLTKTNATIQKIIAFESGFDKIMEIIEGEGSVLDGSVVIEDCLNLLLNLLQSNHSNQSFFKEANYIKKLCSYLDLNSSTSPHHWEAQKINNMKLLLKLIRCLVAPVNQHQFVLDCQQAYRECGLLHRLCALITSSNVPPELLSDSIITVGEVIRGSIPNQTQFANVVMQANPPSPIITVLLLLMINEKQPFHLRSSVLYCFQCFLFKNEEKKAEIVNTLLPTSGQQPQKQITTGQILCTGLFNQNDFVSVWLCAVALAHTINDNNTLKEQLLKVTLAVDGKPVSLLQQAMNILVDSSSSASHHPGSLTASSSHRVKFQTTVAILMLMSIWLANCPSACNYFLSHSQNVPYLISQASSTDTDDRSLIIQGLSSFLLGLTMLYNTNQVSPYSCDYLRDIVRKRIGIEQFEHKLELITQHESYTKTLKTPPIAFKSIKPDELLFDHEFTRLFKSNETLIVNLLNNKNLAINGGASRASNDLTNGSQIAQFQQQIEHQNNIILQYQNFIRDQDSKLKEQISLNQTLSQQYTELSQRYVQLESQKQCNNAASRVVELEQQVKELTEKQTELEAQVARMKKERALFEETVDHLQAGIGKTNFNELIQQIHELNEEQENLLILLTDLQSKLKKYKKLAKKRGDPVSEDEEEEDEEEEDDNEKKSQEQNMIVNLNELPALNLVQPVKHHTPQISPYPIEIHASYQPANSHMPHESTPLSDNNNIMPPTDQFHQYHQYYSDHQSYPVIEISSPSHQPRDPTPNEESDDNQDLKPKNNIYKIIESNVHSNSHSGDDTSSLVSNTPHHFHNHSSDDSQQSTSQQSNLNINEPPRPQILDSFAHNPQQQQYFNPNANFMQYFHNPEQTQMYQKQAYSDVSDVQTQPANHHSAANPLQNYFK